MVMLLGRKRSDPERRRQRLLRAGYDPLLAHEYVIVVKKT